MANVEEPYTAPIVSSKPSLADLLTVESSASIFYSYARELQLSEGLSREDFKLTLFVPTNKAVMNLTKKPNQLADDQTFTTEAEFDQASKANVERWVSAHIIPGAGISFSESHETLLPGKSITFKPINKAKNPDWSQVTMENGIHIVSRKEASNGELYMIDGAILPDLD
ncbi:hypothetical protein BKA70DRAFT_1370835 [Coprinopsis sp. MPI-PUGE-AT-0042]|nr:hypothetical protein BKA70DRAFT_1370835 [Coprinopsis sp. MPI-PUGE-AT-0042]